MGLHVQEKIRHCEEATCESGPHCLSDEATLRVGTWKRMHACVNKTRDPVE